MCSRFKASMPIIEGISDTHLTVLRWALMAVRKTRRERRNCPNPNLQVADGRVL
jgi:hypothetical protein